MQYVCFHFSDDTDFTSHFRTCLQSCPHQVYWSTHHTKGYVYTLVFLLCKFFSSSFPERSSVHQLSFHAERLKSYKSHIFHFWDTPSLTLLFWVFHSPVPPWVLCAPHSPGFICTAHSYPTIASVEVPHYCITETKSSYSERRLHIVSGNI